jgi:hypothetical protein
VPDRHARIEQRALEGEAAADEEADEVGAPPPGHVRCLVDELPVDVDAVQRDVGPDVAGEQWPGDFAGLEHVEHRAGLWVALGEQQEVPGEVARAAMRLAWV